MSLETPQTKLFRKEALDSSSGRMDDEGPVAPIGGGWWLALVAVVMIVAVGLIWGWFGRIPTRIDGMGMIMEPSGFRNVVSMGTGTLASLNVAERDAVREGDVIAVLALPLQDIELGFLRERLELLEQELEELAELTERSHGDRIALFDRIRAENQKILTELLELESQLVSLSQRYTRTAEQGAISDLERMRMRQEWAQLSLLITRQRQDDLRIGLERGDADHQLRREYWAQLHRRMDAEYELRARMAQYLNESMLLSPVDGTVVNVQKSVGDRVVIGEVMVLLQPDSARAEPLMAKTFVPATQSKGIRPGQTAHVVPTNLEPQRHGYIVGKVSSVGHYPATFEQLVTVFKNHDLTRMLQGEQVAVMVEVELVSNPYNPTGYEWTGRAPDNVFITAGSICAVSFITEQRQPLSYVMPWLREKLLGEGLPPALAPVGH